MSFLSLLETILIGPLKLVFEMVFTLALRLTDNPGLAIVFLSLVMNILVLPLYKRADAMQERARDVDAKLSAGVSHIRKTFTGDERMMILQTYYRQNHYRPTDAMKGSVSLLLEIPFFMAAYQFLSHLDIMNGTPLGPIENLGAPDTLLTIGGVTIHLLPFVMTGINILASVLYLKGFPLKSKIQVYAMAAFFLVFLYNSPACLLFYWTLNNVFSLGKNICYRIFRDRKPAQAKKIRPKKEWQPDKKTFYMGCVFLTILIGVLIPSAYLAASPQEYVDITHFVHPLWFLAASAAMAVGTFLLWLPVFYGLAKPGGKVFMERSLFALGIMMFVTYMFFGKGLGVISSDLQYEGGLWHPRQEQLINAALWLVVGVGLYFLAAKFRKMPAMVLLVAALSLGCMSVINGVKVNQSISALLAAQEAQSREEFHIPLSKDGKNVVVIMLDRALGEYIPYFLEEKPELKETFAGFTYYDNCISHGGYTNMGVPGMMGGYEYTPVEMNKRQDEKMVDKHNEALKVMPTLFSQNGYQVTLANPPYANYQWVPDISIFNDIENCNAYTPFWRQGAEQTNQVPVQRNMRNFFCFSLMKTIPLPVQRVLYNGGRYLQAPAGQQGQNAQDSAEPQIYEGQTIQDKLHATGYRRGFMMNYQVLETLKNVTKIQNGEENTFLFLCNDSTHEPMMLQMPGYEPAYEVDNSQYPELLEDRVGPDGQVLKLETDKQIIHYQSNMAALLQVGKWLDFLRENGVYDNTRIILVSDHGNPMEQIDSLMLENGADLEHYFPLLMVKDFGAQEFTVCHDFMTNADVPSLALQGLVENPVNPFTGKPISMAEKENHRQYITMSYQWELEKQPENTFNHSRWAAVKDNIWDKDNWEFYNEETILQNYELPY